MKKRGFAKERLIEAASLEFNERGYDGTNSNEIARRADYAPQTFYRHFEDKRAIFLAVYEQWAASELEDVARAKTPGDIADALIRHHQAHRLFRQSLRSLTASDPLIAQARAASRLRQIELFSPRVKAASLHEKLAMLLFVERLCDAIAEGEFAACNLDENLGRAELIKLISGAIA